MNTTPITIMLIQVNSVILPNTIFPITGDDYCTIYRSTLMMCLWDAGNGGRRILHGSIRGTAQWIFLDKLNSRISMHIQRIFPQSRMQFNLRKQKALPTLIFS